MAFHSSSSQERRFYICYKPLKIRAYSKNIERPLIIEVLSWCHTFNSQPLLHSLYWRVNSCSFCSFKKYSLETIITPVDTYSSYISSCKNKGIIMIISISLLNSTTNIHLSIWSLYQLTHDLTLFYILSKVNFQHTEVGASLISKKNVVGNISI